MTTPGIPEDHQQGNSRSTFRRIVEFQGVRNLSLKQYRSHVQSLYDGPAGAMLSFCSFLSLHEPLVGHLLKSGRFDVSQHRRILDVGSGAGQILGHLLQTTHPDTQLVAFDLSHQMLRRARTRLNSKRPRFFAGDLMHLPFADNSFDCVTCGWVLEHLPDPVPGLQEIGRVLRPGGRALILATEDTFSGVLCSRTWKCRTYNRTELENACARAGLPWKEQLWFTRVHKFFRLGGILVEARKPVSTGAEPEATPDSAGDKLAAAGSR